MLQKVVAVTVAIVVGVPLVYYASIVGADVGVRFSGYTEGAIREYIGLVGGGVLGCAAAVFATASLQLERHA